MKKILCAILALIMCLGVFSACTNETPATGSSSSTPSSSSSVPPVDVQTITIAEALELCGEPGNITEERYYIRGIVESISNATYGAMVISDETGEISVYGTYSEDGSLTYAEMTEKPYKGDEVLLYCILQNYNGTKEIKNAWLIDFTANKADVDPTLYTDMSIAEAREAEAGTLIKVDGVVARITYANGQIPTGVYLVDGTNSILIHDRDLAQRVAIGNKITVLGSKAYWILDTEKNNAEKFGYKGSCQLEDAYLLDNDSRTDNAFDHSWIPETTVKDLLNTSVTENITTSIVKVNALVKRVQEPGYVNYYIYDLDGKTGTYVYTQCNGSDFAWLDAFDGKICTVYLSPINAKSTDSACYFRLQPVQVIDESYKFDLSQTAEFIINYFAKDQFLSAYTGDPCLELVTRVSSDLLGFTNATISYTSSDPTIVKFEELNGKTYLRGIRPGTATITVIADYQGNTCTFTMDITIGAAEMYEFITVGAAINAAAGTTVTVKGIVGPGVVNKSAFYLIDETGAIAVSMDASQFEGLKIGQEVIIEGVRAVDLKEGRNCFGQSYIDEAKIISNAYGNHEYSTQAFISDKTLADFAALDKKEDHTTEVYVLKATIKVVSAAYYSNVYVTSGDVEILLYSSNGAKQYGWLTDYDGQEVTVELAACNWNSKDNAGQPYAGCVLAIYTEDGKIFNPNNFQ